MGNVLIQTPFPIFGLQPYFTTGAGVYRESLGGFSETNFGVNTGGGVKISLIGPGSCASRLSRVHAAGIADRGHGAALVRRGESEVLIDWPGGSLGAGSGCGAADGAGCTGVRLSRLPPLASESV